MLRTGAFGKSLFYLVFIFLGWVTLGAALGIGAGMLAGAGPGLTHADLDALGKILITEHGGHGVEKTSPAGLSTFLRQVIPHNVFEAFADGRSLAVVFISILMGVALGTSRTQAGERLLETVRGIYETFFTIMGWALYGLPLGLCCITASQTALLGAGVFVTLLRLIVLFYAGCVVLCVLYLGAMRYVTGRTFRTLLTSLKGSLLLSFVASNSLVAMPIAMRSLVEELDQPAETVEMVAPLATAMNRHAYPLLFGLVTLYVASAYGVRLAPLDILVVCVASALVGMANVGPAASAAPMAAVILASVGLPTQLAATALVETTAIVTPMLAMTHLFGSCATASIIASIQKRNGRRASELVEKS